MAFYDRVLVLDKGEVSEYDTPLALLENPDSEFRSMCEKVSQRYVCTEYSVYGLNSGDPFRFVSLLRPNSGAACLLLFFAHYTSRSVCVSVCVCDLF